MQANKVPIQNSLKPGKWLNSTCKMCLHACGIRVHVTDGGIVNKFEGNPTNPANSGRMCPNGNAAILRHYDPNRFTPPLKRSNPEKGPGVDPKWIPIGWDETYETVARELKKYCKKTLAACCRRSTTSRSLSFGLGHRLSAVMPTSFPRSAIFAAAATIR